MQNLKGARKKDTHFALVKTWLKKKKSFLGAENKPFDRKKHKLQLKKHARNI